MFEVGNVSAFIEKTMNVHPIYWVRVWWDDVMRSEAMNPELSGQTYSERPDI